MPSRYETAFRQSINPARDAAEIVEAMREALIAAVRGRDLGLVAAPLQRCRNLVSRPMIGDILGEICAEILGITTGEFTALADTGRIQGGPTKPHGGDERTGRGGKRILDGPHPHRPKLGK